MSSSHIKLRRKMCKYQSIILNDYGIKLSQYPTEVLMICNGGLVNGVSQEIIFETFSIAGEIVNVIMLPRKSYCFVLFKDVAHAEEAFKKLNNKNIWPQINGPVYLAFAERTPETLSREMNFADKPPGLFVYEDFLTEEEENRLLECVSSYYIDKQETKPSALKNRRVCHFGYEFKYSNNNVNVNEPLQDIPQELNFIWERLKKISLKLGLGIHFTPDQLTINNYQPGQGIPPHVDTHSPFEDPIVSLSLQSSVIMEFRDCHGKYCPVLLPARSLCIMSGESRYGWTHGIATRKSDIIPGSTGSLTLQFRKERTSLTFRKVKDGDCNCNFPQFCDTRLRQCSAETELNTLEEEAAEKLEESYVHEVYENISGHFSETRHKPWPNVLKFVQSLPSGSILVDVGCGNGKYFNSGSGNFQIGLDASFNLMEVCRERGFECFVANCLRIPLRDNVADGCISIAVIHHLATEERRKRAIKEMVRILRPNGRALIYVWAKNQERENKKSSYLKGKSEREAMFEEKSVVLNDVAVTLPVHTNRTSFVHKDLLVPWKLKETYATQFSVHLRYYHVFGDEELRELCSDLDGAEIIDYYYDQGNWCIALRKL